MSSSKQRGFAAMDPKEQRRIAVELVNIRVRSRSKPSVKILALDEPSTRRERKVP